MNQETLSKIKSLVSELESTNWLIGQWDGRDDDEPDLPSIEELEKWDAAIVVGDREEAEDAFWGAPAELGVKSDHFNPGDFHLVRELKTARDELSELLDGLVTS